MIATLLRPGGRTRPTGLGAEPELAARALWHRFTCRHRILRIGAVVRAPTLAARGQPGPSLPLLARLSWWRRGVAASRLRLGFCGHLVCLPGGFREARTA